MRVSIGDSRVLCFCGFLESLQVCFRRTKSPCDRSLGSYRSATSAKTARREQKTRRGEPRFGCCNRSKSEPLRTCQRAGSHRGTVDTARRGALIRQVSSAEEPTESAAKKRQCERSHRPKERDECATRASAEEGESLEWNKSGFTTQPEEGQLGKTLAVLKECRINRMEAKDREHCEGERQCGEDTDRRSVTRAAIVRVSEGTWTTGESREGSS